MQCGPGAQLTSDFSKLQGLGLSGGQPLMGGMGPEGDMAHMAMMEEQQQMMMGQHHDHHQMMAEFNQMNIGGGVPAAAASSAAMSMPQQQHNLAGPNAMAANPMMMGGVGPMMMGGPMMGGPMMMMPPMMGGGPMLMRPYQTSMMMQQQQPVVAAPSATASAAQNQKQAPLPPLPEGAPSLEAMLAAPLDESNWAQQFKTEQSAKTVEEQDGVKTLGHEGEDLRSVEEKTTDSQFYGFMEKVNDGRVVIDEENAAVKETDAPLLDNDDWATQLKAAQTQVDGDYATQMAGHVPNPTTEAWRMRDGEAEATDVNNMIDELDRVGAGVHGDEDEDFYAGGEEFYDANLDMEAWDRERTELLGRFADAQNATDYPFEKDNAFMYNDDPLSEGKQLLAMGILSDAVLAFEAACQKTPENAEAWKFLGTTQAENEKDMLAIRALNKAKQINPRDKEVYMALSVSHANESNHAFALESLRGWLLCQPEYEMLVDVVASNSAAEASAAEGEGEDYAEFVGMMASPKEMRDIVTLFGAAIEMNPADAALHTCLGIAHHLSQDFESAVACFRAALEVSPDDAQIWNKLGATLANSSKSDEAIAMYENALNINPGYVRARYNLGIAHNNLGHHEIAAQHFARAIVMQQGGAGDDSSANGGPPRSTREMWDALRMALNFTNRQDLVQYTWKQEIAPILQEFGLSDVAF